MSALRSHGEIAHELAEALAAVRSAQARLDKAVRAALLVMTLLDVKRETPGPAPAPRLFGRRGT